MAKDKNQKYFELTEKPDETMHSICRHVASGGSLIEWCDLMQVHYGDISYWIRSDKERNRLWVDCQNDRKEWIKDRLLLELRRIMTSDIRKVFDEKGNILPVHEWPDEVASFVASIETVEEFQGKGKDKEKTGFNKKLKLWNKDNGIQAMMKHLGMLTETVQHSGKITLEELVNASREDSEDGQEDQHQQSDE